MDGKIESFIEKYCFEVDYIDESFEDEIEDILIPLRQYLQRDDEALDAIVSADEKLIRRYDKLKDDSYLKMILTPIYELALKNLKNHDIEAA